ncbi:hypothetical protein GYMLUDRAFT_240512 [Collybiopsis luxurians FD-317 M1]|nr:hypothetical protein GYMLUDRAFT_240512 [Collybiopsis luxurians FD-317 M1]
MPGGPIPNVGKSTKRFVTSTTLANYLRLLRGGQNGLSGLSCPKGGDTGSATAIGAPAHPWDNWCWYSDTGAFDDEQTQRRYISQFLPTEFQESATGQALLSRAWQWLRGQYQYTASYLTVSLAGNFESPHTLLGDYINKLAKFKPPDNDSYPHGEAELHNNWYTELGSRELESNYVCIIEMHRAAITYLTTSKGCLDCETEDRALVIGDYGYFVDAYCFKIALDEPLTVIHGAGWLKDVVKLNYGITMFETFGRDYCIEIRPTHFVLFLALSFASLFAGPSKLSNAFKVTGSLSSLFKARLVTSSKLGDRLEAAEVSFSEKYSRLTRRCGSDSGGSPSLVFGCVPSTFTEKENPTFALDVENARPAKIFHDQPEIISLLEMLPNLYHGMGPTGVLRVSRSLVVDKATEKSIPREESPAAILNIEALSEAVKGLSKDLLMRHLARIFPQSDVSSPPSTVSVLPLTLAGNGDGSGQRRRSTSARPAAAASGSSEQKQDMVRRSGRNRSRAPGSTSNTPSAAVPSSPSEPKQDRLTRGKSRVAASSAAPMITTSNKRRGKAPSLLASIANDGGVNAEAAGGSSRSKRGPQTERKQPQARTSCTSKIRAMATGSASPGVPSTATDSEPSRHHRDNLRKRPR